MRVVVVGGTGLAGRHTVAALEEAGHQAVVATRSTGVDLTTGAGLVEVLTGAEAVIDVTNGPADNADAAARFFAGATQRLMVAEAQAGVRHHVVLSIACLDGVPGNAHYVGKRAQEAVALAGPVPVTILRATQFHEFPAQVVSWVRDGDTATIPPLLLQPVAVRDVGHALAAVAVGEPQGRARDLAGPEPQDFVDMARRTLAARGESVRLIPSWHGPFGGEPGDAMLPGPDADLAPTTFDAWLRSEDARATLGPLR